MSEPCAVIIPDRGDRKELTNFCLHQLSKQTKQPDKVYHVNYKPLGEYKDLTERVKKGIELAQSDGIDNIHIIENDDNYKPDYLEKVELNGYDFIGASETLCYNLRYNSWQQYQHPDRASLFCTSFKISALKHFRWPDPDLVMLDLKLWGYALRQHRVQKKFFNEPLAIAIKHGIGKAGGKGHHMNYANKDPDRSYLKSIVDSEAFVFYSTLRLNI